MSVTTTETLAPMTDITRGQHFRQRRRVVGLSQVELAVESGVSESSIRNLERGKDGMEKTATLVAATLDRIEKEQGAGEAVPALPPLLKATLAVGPPGPMRVEDVDGVIRFTMLVRPPGMSPEEFARRVAAFDAGR